MKTEDLIVQYISEKKNLKTKFTKNVLKIIQDRMDNRLDHRDLYNEVYKLVTNMVTDLECFYGEVNAIKESKR